MKKLAIPFTFLCLLSFSFGQVPIQQPPPTRPIPKPPTRVIAQPAALKITFIGTQEAVKKHFYTNLEQGIDTLRDIKTKKLITGSITVIETNGKTIGTLNLLNGKMHGEELVFDDNEKIVEINYWINGMPSKTPPPK
ncbi:MAG: hypothetical protein HN553_10115, partial [Opitutae bacterium]|nr:hypothetical protein [Opitutae bacterium]